MIFDLAKIFKELIAEDQRPVVVYASVWPFIKAHSLEPVSAAKLILDLILEAVGDNRTLLMPTFASGFKDGICNLDTEPSTTGILSEEFRKLSDSRRTLSSFFSFNVKGPESEEVLNLLPNDAWGENSVYHWMEQTNAHFFMLGIHPTHCSYLHRLEWLINERINYRYQKSFEGTLIREEVRYDVQENLFVRNLNPPVINDFTTLLPILKSAGLDLVELDGVSISHVTANQINKSCIELLKKDPFLVLKNRVDYEK